MRHTKRIVAVAVFLLAVVGKSEGQSAYEHASLEAHRWEVYAAGEMVIQASRMLSRARKHRARIEPAIKKTGNKVTQEKDKAERGNRDPDEPTKAEVKLFGIKKHFSVTEARIVAAQSHLSAAEARFISAKAVVVAAEAAPEEAFVTALTAHVAVLEAVRASLRELIDIIKLDEGKRPGVVDFVAHNDNPSADQVTTVWESAALAARAAERAEAIVEALNGGGPLPPELLEPLPTEFRDLA